MAVELLHLVSEKGLGFRIAVITLSKSALPTPTMTIERGWPDAETIAWTVLSMSVISPSVRMRSTTYCCLFMGGMRQRFDQGKEHYVLLPV